MANQNLQVKIQEDGFVVLNVGDVGASVDKDVATYFQYDPKIKNVFKFQRFPHASGYQGARVTAVITNKAPYNRQYGTLIFWSNDGLEWFSVENGKSKAESFSIGTEYSFSFQAQSTPGVEFAEIEVVRQYVALTYLTMNRKDEVMRLLSDLDDVNVSDAEVSQWFELLERNAAKWPEIEAGLVPFADLIVMLTNSLKQHADAVVSIIEIMPSYKSFSAMLEALPTDPKQLENMILTDDDALKVSLVAEALEVLNNDLNVFVEAGTELRAHIDRFKEELMNQVRPGLASLLDLPEFKIPLAPLADALKEVSTRLDRADVGIVGVQLLWANTVEDFRSAELKVPTATGFSSFERLKTTLRRATKNWGDAEVKAKALKEALAFFK